MTIAQPDARALSPALVAELQTVRDYPAVSILMATEPAAEGMRRHDAVRLDRLAARAARRVREELPAMTAAMVIGKLHMLCQQAWRQPASRGLAIYASPSFQALVRLPLPVSDRCVVDPTFATRELIRALHRTPRHLVLQLGRTHAQLYDAAGEALVPALASNFPVQDRRGRTRLLGRNPLASEPHGTGDVTDAPARSRLESRPPARLAGERARILERRHDFLARVDQALGAYAQLHPAPLVLVGEPAVCAAFVAQSRHCDRLAGIVPGRMNPRSMRRMRARIRDTLNAYLARREQEALRLVAERAASGRVIAGIHDAWLAARVLRPEMLVVDEALHYPARLSAGGDRLEPASDVDHPDVLDDAVDELIELVLMRGGWIALARPGTLAEHDGVALVVRP